MDNLNYLDEKEGKKKQLSQNQQGSLTNLYNVNLNKVQNSKLFQKFLEQEKRQINKKEENPVEELKQTPKELPVNKTNEKIIQGPVMQQIPKTAKKDQPIQNQQSPPKQILQKEDQTIQNQFQQPIQLSPYSQKLSPENKRLIKLQKTNHSKEKKQFTNISAQKPMNYNDLIEDEEDNELQGYSEIIGNPYTQSMIKQQQQSIQPYAYPLAQPQNYQQAQEILLLKQTIQEQNQQIQKLTEILKMGENQELQVNNSLFIANQTIEELKGKLALNKDKTSNEYFQYEERLSLQNQKVYELQKTEDELRTEIDDLRRKILKEINEKTQFQNMFSETTKRNEEFSEIIREKDSQLYKKNDELFLLKKEFDAQKFQLQSLNDFNQKFQERLQTQEQLTQSQQFELESKQNQINQLLLENHGNKLELQQKNQQCQSQSLQLKNQQSEIEQKNLELENQIFRKQKQQQNEINQQLGLEKAYLEISSLRQEVQKIQYSLEAEQNKNFILIQKISQIQQWEQQKQFQFPISPNFPQPISIPKFEIDYKQYEPTAPPSRAASNFEPKFTNQQELLTPKQQPQAEKQRQNINGRYETYNSHNNNNQNEVKRAVQQNPIT